MNEAQYRVVGGGPTQWFGSLSAAAAEYGRRARIGWFLTLELYAPGSGKPMMRTTRTT